MNILSTLQKSAIRSGIITCAAIVLLSSSPASAQQNPRPAAVRPASPAEINVPLSDARTIEPNSVRFSAAQFTKDAPTIVIFGVSGKNWPKLKAAIQQAAFEGYAVKAVFIGPANEAPALEIYAKGHHVTNPINPNTIAQRELTKLVKDVVREYY